MRSILTAIILMVCLNSSLLAQGRLADIREDIQNETPSNPQPSCKKEEDEGMGGFIAAFLGGLFSGCGREVERDSPLIERAPELSFPVFPYPLGLEGYMQVDPTPTMDFTGNETGYLFLKPWSAQFSLDYGTDFQGFHKLSGRFFLEGKSRWGVQTNWHYLYEELGCGCYADAGLGNILLTLRIIEDNKVLVRGGLGGQLFTDAYLTEGGVAASLSADIFPIRPLVVSGLVEGGSLGGTGTLRTRVSVGALWKGLEMYGGYEFLQIGSTNFHLPIAGLRFWF